MLAERRERRKWSVNPNGTTWSQDTNKFGTKMLEKMGWTEGKGLGANEDGRTQHIRVKKKNDYRGLGCSVKEAHKWVAHQDDFTSLLAQLNGHHSENAQAEKEVVSLEKHSKSQKRVHYHKFTRGKDLSNYGQNDLDAIFGRKKKASKSAPVTPIELSEESSSGEESAASCPEEVSSKKSKKRKHGDGGGNQITSTLSVQEYFAQRMAKLKNKSTDDNSTEQTVNDKDATGDKKVVEKKTSCLNGDTSTNSEIMESKGGQSLNNYITSNISVQEYFKQRMATAKGKSSLSKPTEETKTNDGDSVSNEKVTVVERNNEILPSDEKVLKKKKKKKLKKITDEQNSVNLRNDEQSHKKDKPKKSTLNHDNELKSGVTTPQKKKSKKRKVIDDSGNGDQSDVSTEKKKCKKRKKDRTCIDDNNSSKAKRSE